MLTNFLKFILIFSFLLSISSRILGQPATLVVTDTIKKIEFRDQLTLVSRTQAIRSSQVVAAISGQVARINASEGTKVKRGAPLVTIEQATLQAIFDAKKAEANRAKAQSEAAAREFERTKGLHSQDLISESIIDSDSATAIAALERYHQLTAERKRLAIDLANCIIKAPFSGHTGRQLIDVGEWVNPGTPVFELIDPSAIKVTVDLPERYFGRLEVGSEVMVTASNDPGKSRTGRVTGISPSASVSTHTFPVFVTVDNKDGFLGGGMLVRATLSLNKKFTSLAVSKDAIVRQGLQTMVYTIEDGKAVMIPVVTSSTNEDMIAIEGDRLREGMPVVVRGNERIFPGSPVRLQGESSNHSN
ncbi:efflux RND transporter periplasmic adaptor subunit [candidate division KSB1 bacterium]|nr:efflux RND transporter periplasmic adaptor subunit [candidate division KSB1 bacterium]